jgi:hypothetical protein
MKNWYKRWMLRRIILALQYACEHHGLKNEVKQFAGALEATLHMAAGNKHDQQVTITVTKKELSTFIGYMIQLHNAKLSLLTRARIGLVSLLIKDKKLMPNEQDPMDFAQEQFAKSKSAKDDKNIIQLNR